MKQTILLVDDDRSVLDTLERALSGIDARLVTAGDGQEAADKLDEVRPQIVVADLKMPRMDGLQLLSNIKSHASEPAIQTILLSGHGTIDDAVLAMKRGAYDFITKPFKKLQLVATVQRAMEKVTLMQENLALKEKIKRASKGEIDLGKSREFRELLERSVQAAKSDATILILGESGTGKEVLAHYLWENSPRAGLPFFSISCSAISEQLLEADLFGFRKGAFPGALQDRAGKLSLAHGGTVFFDEVSDMPPLVQAKIVRLLQEHEICPLGGKFEHADVRLMASTSKDLRRLVEAGRFREDLFYRLNVIPITIPPLRERPEDLASLVSFFIQKYCKKNKLNNLSLSADALRLIENYPWPGNVRELENAVERAVILCRGHQIIPKDLPPELSQSGGNSLLLNFGKGMSLEEIERFVIQASLRRFDGDKARTAEELGISLRTIYRKLESYDGVAEPPVRPV